MQKGRKNNFRFAQNGEVKFTFNPSEMVIFVLVRLLLLLRRLRLQLKLHAQPPVLQPHLLLYPKLLPELHQRPELRLQVLYVKFVVLKPDLRVNPRHRYVVHPHLALVPPSHLQRRPLVRKYQVKVPLLLLLLRVHALQYYVRLG